MPHYLVIWEEAIYFMSEKDITRGKEHVNRDVESLWKGQDSFKRRRVLWMEAGWKGTKIYLHRYLIYFSFAV